MEVDYNNLKMSELKVLLTKRGLSVTGRKSDLIDRIISYENSDSRLDNLEVENKSKNINEIENDNNSNLPLYQIENQILQSFNNDSNHTSGIDAQVKSDLPILIDKFSDNKKVTNLNDSDMLHMERLEKRQKRFGAVTEDDKKLSRAKRFDLFTPELEKQKQDKRIIRFTTHLTSNENETNQFDDEAEDRKKINRAKRFGLVDEQEKIAQRSLRFGFVDQQEKLKQRELRFGTHLT